MSLPLNEVSHERQEYFGIAQQQPIHRSNDTIRTHAEMNQKHELCEISLRRIISLAQPISEHDSAPSTPSRVSRQGHQLCQPPFPCLNCDETFKRLLDWTRHAHELHESACRQVCRHPGCDRSFSRADKLRDHYRMKHGIPIPKRLTIPPSSDVNKRRIWGCGFCVYHQMDWKDFAKHIWFHFQAGKVKGEWNDSLCIHSLLQHPSVHLDWHAIFRQLAGNDKYNISQLRWSADNIKLLREDLEWEYTNREPGHVLAFIAYKLLDANASHCPMVLNPSLSSSLDQVLPDQLKSSLLAPDDEAWSLQPLGFSQWNAHGSDDFLETEPPEFNASTSLLNLKSRSLSPSNTVSLPSTKKSHGDPCEVFSGLVNLFLPLHIS